MILFMSGGGSPWIGEMQLEKPSIMLSYFTNVNQKTGRADSRMRKLLRARKKAKGQRKTK